MIEIKEFNVEKSESGIRLDLYLASKFKNKTRSAIQNILLNNESLTVNGSPSSKHYIVKHGDLIRLSIHDDSNLQVSGEDIPLDICYEDEDVLIINKPQGMVVHPAPGHRSGTLVNALIFYLGDYIANKDDPIRPGIVHRIDKDTSGLLIVAKNDMSHLSLSEQIRAHSFSREYEAVVHGYIEPASGVIEAPIGRDPKNRKRMSVTQRNSKVAITKYKVIKQYKEFAHIRLKLYTGRTHQIRVHMSYIGHPVAGDPLYGPRHHQALSLKGQCLHAKLIGFIHPRSGQYIELESPLPKYFLEFLKNLE
jgi:23S rRNA pseudouridine1911/1915/1917 synthase